MKSTEKMESALRNLCVRGLLQERTERNPYLKVSYKGAGGEIASSWNVKIYNSGSVVTTDEHLLYSFSDGSYSPPNSRLRVLQVDDAGWGYPLCGIMVGVSDGRELMTGVVDVRWFKKGVFDTRQYLLEYSRIALDIIQDHFLATPDSFRVEICAGFVNSTLKDDLRRKGFDVRIAKVTGFLQDRLEKCYRDYVKIALGADMCYDPKEYADNKIALAKKYAAVLEWGKKNKPNMLKDGWSSIKNE